MLFTIPMGHHTFKDLRLMVKFIPAAIGIMIGLILYFRFRWWGFLVLFPWIGISISIGIHLGQILAREKKTFGRKVSILLIMPALLFFVPLANHENLQLEGVMLLVLAGIFTKGFIHYAIAKIFGPLIWGRGFCGWACWTAAILDWLPIKKEGTVSPGLKNLRYLALAISLFLPMVLVFGMNYDVHSQYLRKAELGWMLIGNVIYYLFAIPLAFFFKDKRAFCKIACPVSLVMKVPTQLALIRKRPSGIPCTQCGLCNEVCPMDNDVMSFISKGRKVMDTECILCGECTIHCPVGAIR
jgi:ferredoxin-type protein NapH